VIQLYFIGCFWITFSTKVGSWNLLFPLAALPLGLSFGSVYAFMLLFGVLLRSTAFTTVIGLIYVLLLSNLLASREKYVVSMASHARVIGKLMDVLYYSLPQISDLRKSAVQLLLNEP